LRIYANLKKTMTNQIKTSLAIIAIFTIVTITAVCAILYIGADYQTTEIVLTNRTYVPDPTDSREGLVDINTADKKELMTIPGIGVVFSERIIEYREIRGRFVSIHELKEIQGITDNKFEEIKPYIVCFP